MSAYAIALRSATANVAGSNPIFGSVPLAVLGSSLLENAADPATRLGLNIWPVR